MRISLIVTDAEYATIKEAAQGVPLTKFILRTLMNNVMPAPPGNLLGTDAERAKIKDQMRELVPTIPGKAAYDAEDRLPDFVADEPTWEAPLGKTEESSGSGTDQDVRRYEDLPANPGSTTSRRRQVGRNDRASSRDAKRGGKRGTRPTRESNVRCDAAVGPGLYCPKCDRRH